MKYTTEVDGAETSWLVRLSVLAAYWLLKHSASAQREEVAEPEALADREALEVQRIAVRTAVRKGLVQQPMGPPEGMALPGVAHRERLAEQRMARIEGVAEREAVAEPARSVYEGMTTDMPSARGACATRDSIVGSDPEQPGGARGVPR